MKKPLAIVLLLLATFAAGFHTHRLLNPPLTFVRLIAVPDIPKTPL